VAVGGRGVRHGLLEHQLGERARIFLELLMLRRVRTVAAAGDGEGKRAVAVRHAEMQRGEGAHRQPDNVRALDAERIEHTADIVAGARLRVALELLRNVGGRIAARVIRDAAIAAREMAQLRLPAASVARELVHEQQRDARAGFFVIQLDAVVRGQFRHLLISSLIVAFYVDESGSLQAVRAAGDAGRRGSALAARRAGRSGGVGQGGERQFSRRAHHPEQVPVQAAAAVLSGKRAGGRGEGSRRRSDERAARRQGDGLHHLRRVCRGGQDRRGAAAADPAGHGFRERIKGLTEGRGVDVIFDAVGGTYSEPAFRSIAWRGRLLVVGFASGEIPKLPLNLALLKGAAAVGVFWGDFARREPKAFAESIAQLGLWFREGKLRPHVSKTYPLEKAAEALKLMAARQVKGKVVLAV